MREHGEHLLKGGNLDLSKLRFSVMAKEDRKQIARALAKHGESTREIAEKTGWSQSTIARDVGESNDSESESNDSLSAKRAAKEAERQARRDALAVLVARIVSTLYAFQPRNLARESTV